MSVSNNLNPWRALGLARSGGNCATAPGSARCGQAQVSASGEPVAKGRLLAAGCGRRWWPGVAFDRAGILRAVGRARGRAWRGEAEREARSVGRGRRSLEYHAG